MAKSERTIALKKEYYKKLDDAVNFGKTKPKPTWDSSNYYDGPIAYIDKVIKNSKVGSPERQAYIDEKNAYLKKSEEWQKKRDEYSAIADKVLLAYQESM